MKKLLTVLGSTTILFSLSACSYFYLETNEANSVQTYQSTQKAETSQPIQKEKRKENKNEPILFDAKQVKVGDQIGRMSIVDLSVTEEDAPSFAATVHFTGEVTIKGTYHYQLDNEVLGNEISFNVAEESLSELPKLMQDERYIWFTFDNHEEAISMLSINEAEGVQAPATIVIDNYTIRYAPTEIWNTAKIVQIK